MAFNESLAHLLQERRIATLTTFDASGMPHVTAVWFLFRDDALYIATSSHGTSRRRPCIRRYVRCCGKAGTAEMDLMGHGRDGG